MRLARPPRTLRTAYVRLERDHTYGPAALRVLIEHFRFIRGAARIREDFLMQVEIG